MEHKSKNHQPVCDPQPVRDPHPVCEKLVTLLKEENGEVILGFFIIINPNVLITGLDSPVALDPTCYEIFRHGDHPHVKLLDILVYLINNEFREYPLLVNLLKGISNVTNHRIFNGYELKWSITYDQLETVTLLISMGMSVPHSSLKQACCGLIVPELITQLSPPPQWLPTPIFPPIYIRGWIVVYAYRRGVDMTALGNHLLSYYPGLLQTFIGSPYFMDTINVMSKENKQASEALSKWTTNECTVCFCITLDHLPCHHGHFMCSGCQDGLLKDGIIKCPTCGESNLMTK